LIICQGSTTEGLATSSDYDGDDDLVHQPEKLLMFTTGSKTFTPHQIGNQMPTHS
jgi:hypothetical protein